MLAVETSGLESWPTVTACSRQSLSGSSVSLSATSAFGPFALGVGPAPTARKT